MEFMFRGGRRRAKDWGEGPILLGGNAIPDLRCRLDLLGAVPEPCADLICAIQDCKSLVVVGQATVGVVGQAHCAIPKPWNQWPVTAQLPEGYLGVWHCERCGGKVEGTT